MYYSLLDIVILKFCCCSVWRSSPTLWDSMDCSTSGFPVLHCLLEFVQIHVYWVGDAIHPSHPLSSPSPSAFNLPQHQGSFPRSLSIRWPKHWNFSFSISPSTEYSALISFRIDWCDPLAVNQTLKNVLQHQSSKASIFLALSRHYGANLTSMHDYWKNHSFDYADLCRQSDVFVF